MRPGINGVVNNAGSIKVTTPSGDTSSSDGVDAQSNSGVTISNATISGDTSSTSGDTFTIEGERHRITGGYRSDTGNPIGLFTMSVTNAHGFTIQGDNGSGINIDGVGVNASTGAYDVSGTDPDVTTNEMVVISNAGSIIGNGVTRDGDGVDMVGLVQLTNSGTIRSQCAAGDTSEGVTVGGGTITNLTDGVIEGDNAAGKYNCNPVLNSITGTGRGITLAGVDHDVNNSDAPIVPIQAIYGYSTVDNYGTIYGDSDSGVAVTSAASQYLVTIINEAGGTIEGAGQTQAAVSTGSNQAAVINSGTIKADNSGVAIDLGSGDGTHTGSVQIFGGAAQVNGNISGCTASPSTLAIIPNATYSYTANATYNYNSSTGTGTTMIGSSGNSFTYTGVIANFSTAEFGSGTTILTGANTYTGNTTVDTGGILQLDGSIASAQTFVAGTLQGTGNASPGGTVEVQNGGNIYPGDTAGDRATLNTGNLTLDSGSTATFDLGTVAGSNDLIESSGAVTITAANLAINLPVSPTPGSYVLISGTSVNGTFAAPTFSPALPSSLTATIAYNSAAVTLQLQTVSSISLQSSQNPSAFGESVTFTATVSGSTPSGTVTFLDGATTLGTVTLSSGIVTLATTSLSTGWHDITAFYGGDGNNTSSTSSAVKQHVKLATSSVSVASSQSPSVFGQTVTFTATVTGQSPTGNVTFDDGATAICTAVALTGGIAICATSALSAGAHAITAMYSGDGNNVAAASFGIAQAVQSAPTATTAFTTCAETFVESQPFTLSATVSGVNPTGNVTFSNGTDALCSGVSLTAGNASCTTDALAVAGSGTQEDIQLIANYSGDQNNAASASTALTVKVLSAGDVVFRNGLEAETESCPIE